MGINDSVGGPASEAARPVVDGLVDAVATRVHADFLAHRLAHESSTGLPTADLRKLLYELVSLDSPLLASRHAAVVVDRLVAEISGLGALEPILSDPSVTEVMVNGPNRVFVERAGRLRQVECAISAEMIERCIERIITPLGLRIDRNTPYVDARLPDGSRLNAVISPLAVDGPCLTIRRFGATPVALEEFGDQRVVSFLTSAVRAKRSIVVCGATGSGKTTLLRSLAEAVPDSERIVTIEDTAELRITHPHVVRMEARLPTIEGLGAVTVRDLVKNALRMRPDRLVVGEVRGAEALDMVQAMNTGHPGSFSTVHANSTAEAIRRLEVMVLLSGVPLTLTGVSRLLGGAIDLLVHVGRTTGGCRQITEISRLVLENGSLEARPVFVKGRGRDATGSDATGSRL